MDGVHQTNWIGFVVFAAIVLVFPLIATQSFYITQATFAGIYTIVAIGLGMLMGYAGQISLGQAAFYGVGAYSTAILTVTFGLSPWLSLLFSLAVPALLAWILGHTMARLSGYYLAMATLAFGIIVYVVLVEWRSLTFGASGFYGIPTLELFGLRLTPGIPYYYFVWIITLLIMSLSFNIVHSRVGRALRSIHDSEVAASVMGVDTGKYKMQIFILSAVYAGLAGWLFAHMSYSISPGSFALNASILFLTMVVLGGSTSVWGAVIGAILITVITVIVHALGLRYAFITSDFEHVLFGLILMLVIIFMPRGLFPTLVDWITAQRPKEREEQQKQREESA
ncbi:branched-chain amino acid ABC transporter permease [Caldalkalibacillus thermarum TA2.A1]|nr:branched-chain amino acid ABC transporter permease [Caldalkalibacillus thermarum TA2.A1]